MRHERMRQFVARHVPDFLHDVVLADEDALADALVRRRHEARGLDPNSCTPPESLRPTACIAPQTPSSGEPERQGDHHEEAPVPGCGIEHEPHPGSHDIDSAIRGHWQAPSVRDELDAAQTSGLHDPGRLSVVGLANHA